METQLPPSAGRQLDRFCRQYLQLHRDLDYPEGDCLRNDGFQQDLYTILFQENAVDHHPPPRYQLRVLKELIRRIEQSIQDWEEEGISDNLMNYLSSLLSSSMPSEATYAQQKSYVTYTLSSLPSQTEKVPTITLLEARSLLAAAGTTGLRTWEAAFHLGNYLCANAANIVRDKSILELGAGTGYISILCAKHLGASHILATDGDFEVITGLSTNFYLNGLQDASFIEGKELVWGQALLGGEHPEWHAGRQIDLVLGADLTYDATNHPALVATIGDLFELYPDVKILIGATIRNPTTFQKFLEICRRNNYGVEEIKFETMKSGTQEGPFYSDLDSIHLYLITRTRSPDSIIHMQVEYMNEKI